MNGCNQYRPIGANTRDGFWVARHTDPQIEQLFQTDTIPTPFGCHVDGEKVKAKIQALNPNYIVEVK